MLQGMRYAARYVWIVLVIAFVGGYLLLDTSGLLSGAQVITIGTSVGSVNGKSITYGAWQDRANALAQQQEQRMGRSADGDERAQLESQAFEELVTAILMDQEYARRHIRITDQEIRDAARLYPPSDVMQNPDLQTDGRFDPDKWERFLASPAVRAQGGLLQLQRYYETELPKMKFFSQLAGDVYPSDAELWRRYQDAHDSAAVSFVPFRAAPGADSAARSQVTNAEIAAYYATYKKQLHSPTRAIVTALVISRRPTPADSALTHTRILATQKRIAAGEKFDAVAKEVSDDTVSGKDGGTLPPSVKGAFVKEFEDVLLKLKPGQQSEPVRTQFGWHLIRLDQRKGDTAFARHILLAFRQSDSSAVKTDRLADELAKLAAGSLDASKLDTASKRMNLTPVNLDVVDGQRAVAPDGSPLPGLSQWATGSGAKAGEISEIFDSDNAYFLARLDSLMVGGETPLEQVRDNIRLYLAQKKAVQARTEAAKAFAKGAVATSFDAAARAQNLKLESTPLVARFQFVPGMGQGSPAIGAAFGLAVGAISEPIVAPDAVYVIRVDKRVNADKTVWLAQAAQQRAQLQQQMQQERIRQYLNALREEANVVDKRREVIAASRGQAQ